MGIVVGILVPVLTLVNLVCAWAVLARAKQILKLEQRLIRMILRRRG